MDAPPILDPLTDKLDLLLPVDLSDTDTILLHFARRVAAGGHVGRICLLHLVQPMPPPDPAALAGASFDADLGLAAADFWVRQAETRLATLQQQPDWAALPLEVQVLQDNGTGLGPQLATYAERHGFELVVTVNKRRGWLATLLEGSALLGIVRGGAVPVLVLSAERTPDIGRILFATDFDAAGADILARLLPLARRLRAGVTCARISTRRQFETTREFAALRREFQEALLLQDPDALPHITEYLHYYADDLAEGIVHAAEDTLADLIVLATHGRTGLQLLLSGSVTEDVLERTGLPILVFRRE